MKGTEYMTNAEDPWPEEGELLVCSVKNVKENGAYLNLDGYGNREAFDCDNGDCLDECEIGRAHV